MLRWSFWSSALLVALLYGNVECRLPLERGEPGFWAELVPYSNRIIGNVDARVIVRAQSGGPPDVRGQVQVRLPSGVELVEGDATRQIHPSYIRQGPKDSEYTITLRASSPGHHEVRLIFRLYDRDSRIWDETEGVLRMSVVGDTVSFKQYMILRYERVEHGQRFRYGGMHMVAIDGPEEFIQGRHEMKPEAMLQATGQCRPCAGRPESQKVRVAVTVGTDGRVTWVEPKPRAYEFDERVWEAAKAAARNWRFRPATYGGRPIADWAEIEVTVEASDR